jgi:LmeA-like phospholipid-binding
VRKLLIALLVLAVLAVVADRVAVTVAERQVASQIQHQADLAGPPSVEIGGFPFLTQAAAGRYSDVRIGLTAAELGQPAGTRADVSLHGVHLSLADVVSGTVQQIPIDRVDGSATLAYTLLANQIGPGTTLRQEGGGLQIASTVEIAGQRFPVTATGTVRLDGRDLVIDVQQASGAGVELPGFLVGRVSDLLGLRYRIPALPFGLRLTGLRAGPDGVVVTVAATDAVLSR